MKASWLIAEVHHHVDIKITVSYYHSYEGVSGAAYLLISKPHCYTCQFKYVFLLEESVSCDGSKLPRANKIQ